MNGAVAESVVAFARVLRTAGVNLGPGSTMDAVAAVQAAGLSTRADFYWTLHAALVKRREDDPVFDAAFRLFFRSRDPNPAIPAETLSVAPVASKKKPAELRAREAMRNNGVKPSTPQREEQSVHDMRGTVSDAEVFSHKDFAQMSAEEIRHAREIIRTLPFAREEISSRRLVSDPRGRLIDFRRTLRASLRTGGNMIDLKRRARGFRRPPLVALLDISGSMMDYSHVFLHFLHALGEKRRVSVFLFGTRLTNVTRALKSRDPDAAIEACSAAAQDWSGGTWISSSLYEFNRRWARRELGQGASVLLITDGLERDTSLLEAEIDRLHRSSRRLIWLNPLLRYDRFEPVALGIRKMLPHVDEFLPVHNLQSLKALTASLANLGQTR